MRAEQLGGRMNDDGVGALDADSAQGGAGLGLDKVGATVGAGGRDRDAEGNGARNEVAQHGLGAAEQTRGVQHRQLGAGGDVQDIASLGFGRATARRGRTPAVEAELSGRQTQF